MNVSRILVVDDDEGDQFLAKFKINQFDPSIEVLQAFDGFEALELLKKPEMNPDVILLDINMPRMNGHEFLEAYSKTASQSVVILMLTSSDQTRDKEKIQDYAFVKAYFVKSIEIEDLELLKSPEFG